MSLPSVFTARPITHRGLHDINAGRAENSRKAFAAAMAHGYGIEMDIQISSDGVPMVFHDYDLGRLTDETGAVAQRSAAALGRISLRHDGDGIPTLAEVLDQVAGAVPLLIELKDQDGGLGTDIGPLSAAVAGVLRGYEGPAAVMSFNPHMVADLATHLPNVPRGITSGAYRAENWPTIRAEVRDRLREIPDYDRTGSCFVSYRDTHLDHPRIAELKAQGATILCWTVRSKEAETAARRYADNITFEGYLA